MADSAGRTVMVQGRIVWVSGDLFKGRVKTEFGTQTPKMNKQGQPITEYGFGLAVPKLVLQNAEKGQPGEIWAAMHEEAYTLYPSRQLPPSFAMKFKDGDGIDDKGAPFAQREGYEKHIVLACTTNLAIKFYRFENGQNFLINEGIKCGDYVNVQLSVKAHGAIGAGKPGLYLNPNAVQFLGYGKEIVNAPSGDAVFGMTAPVVPQGASLTPLAPTGFIAPQQGQFMQPGQSQQPTVPHLGVHNPISVTVPHHEPAAPHYNVLPPAHQPQQQPQQSGPPIPGMPIPRTH